MASALFFGGPCRDGDLGGRIRTLVWVHELWLFNHYTKGTLVEHCGHYIDITWWPEAHASFAWVQPSRAGSVLRRACVTLISWATNPFARAVRFERIFEIHSDSENN